MNWKERNAIKKPAPRVVHVAKTHKLITNEHGVKTLMSSAGRTYLRDDTRARRTVERQIAEQARSVQQAKDFLK